MLTMNLEKWNRLPKHLQDLLLETRLELESVWREMYNEEEAFERQRLIDAGMEFYQFSPEDAEWFVNTAFETEWAFREENWPEVSAKFKE